MLGFPCMEGERCGGAGHARRSRIERSEAAIDSARREAFAAFGDGALFIERYIEGARHMNFRSSVTQRATSSPLRTRVLDSAKASEDHRGDAGTRARCISKSDGRSCRVSHARSAIGMPERSSSFSRPTELLLEVNAFKSSTRSQSV